MSALNVIAYMFIAYLVLVFTIEFCRRLPLLLVSVLMLTPIIAVIYFLVAGEPEELFLAGMSAMAALVVFMWIKDRKGDRIRQAALAEKIAQNKLMEDAEVMWP